jgi:hypothetical protein
MKEKLIDAIVPAILLAVLGAALAMWRDVAVMKTEVTHMKEDVALVRKFIVSPDKKVYTEAKEELEKDAQERH